MVATAQVVNSVVEWHASHGTAVTPLALIGKWLAASPSPCTPSWQAAHPLFTPACVNVAPAQVIVLWQASHSRFVRIWFGGFPCACEPLWHIEQLPRVWV